MLRRLSLIGAGLLLVLAGCGESPEQQVRSAALGLLDAIEQRDPQGFCRAMDRAMVRQLEQGKGKGCADALANWSPYSQGERARIRKARANLQRARIVIRGDTATIRVAGRPDTQMRKQEGAWRIKGQLNFFPANPRAVNAQAQGVLRNAYMAARAYYVRSESYNGYNYLQQGAQEPTLNSAAPTAAANIILASAGQTPGGSAIPTRIYMFQSTQAVGSNGGSFNPAGATIRYIDGTAQTGFNTGSVTSGAVTLVLCSVSQGDTVYCVADDGAHSSYGKLTGTLQLTANPGAWNTSMTWGISW